VTIDNNVSDPVMDVGRDNDQQGQIRSSLRRSAQNDDQLLDEEDLNDPRTYR